jgi:hypothetical protein
MLCLLCFVCFALFAFVSEGTLSYGTSLKRNDVTVSSALNCKNLEHETTSPTAELRKLY